MDDLRSIPLRGPASVQPTRLDMVSSIQRIEVAHRSGSLPDPAHDRYLMCGRSEKTWSRIATAIDE